MKRIIYIVIIASVCVCVVIGLDKLYLYIMKLLPPPIGAIITVLGMVSLVIYYFLPKKRK